MTFKEDLRALLNQHSMDALAETPDYILAEYLTRVLGDYIQTLDDTRRWHGWPTLGERLNLRLATPYHDEGGPHVG